MPATVTASYVLHRHPATACPALLGVTVEVGRADDTLTLLACLPAAALPGAAAAPPLFAAGARWALGLSAVIEQSDGALSYWALAHPRPQPDFHHRGGWAARLSSAR